MSDLRAELSRLQVPESKGLKEDLINVLLAHLLYRSTAAAAAASAAGNGHAAAVPTQVSLASRGELMLHRVSLVLYRTVQQQGVGLQVLTSCQVRLVAHGWPVTYILGIGFFQPQQLPAGQNAAHTWTSVCPVLSIKSDVAYMPSAPSHASAPQRSMLTQEYTYCRAHCAGCLLGVSGNSFAD